jgi:undecaprenyl-diphosphatase
MDMIHAIINAVVQGLTEFLPVSSSGHLVLASSLYKTITGKPMTGDPTQEVFLDIMLHLGTLVAVLIYFKDDLKNIFSSFFNALNTKTLKTNEDAKIVLYIAAATLATIVTVLPFKDIFEADMQRPAIVGIQIMITGVIIYATEFLSARVINKTSSIGWWKSIIIGIAQGIAVSPGISRSGSTIAAGLAMGMDRISCARFSFLMSIPAIMMGVAAKSIEVIKLGTYSGFNWSAIIVGTIISGIVGYYCVKYFIIFISKHRLDAFGAYCLIMGFAMFLYFGVLS